MGRTDTFWFRRETAEGIVFTVVDAGTGEQRPAFDHARILAAAGGTPITDLDLAGPEPRVKLEDGTWLRFSEAGFDQQPRRGAAGLGRRCCRVDRRSSARDGNLWLRDGEGERVLTADGEAGNAYGKSADMNLTTVSLRRRGVTLPPNLLASPDGTRVFTSRLDERGMADYPLVQHVPEDGSPRAPAAHAQICNDRGRGGADGAPRGRRAGWGCGACRRWPLRQRRHDLPRKARGLVECGRHSDLLPGP